MNNHAGVASYILSAGMYAANHLNGVKVIKVTIQLKLKIKVKYLNIVKFKIKI